MSTLLGKAIVQGNMRVLTGLRVGGSTGGLKIGGVDLNVITDPMGKPYIPGSSIKGKTRSLMERFYQKAANQNGLHMCRNDAEYGNCPICKIWGVLGDAKNFSVPTLTRLLVKDAFLDDGSISDEMRKNLELQWTEVKMETAIDRVTGTARHGSLRQIERVPAGACFKDCQFIFNITDEPDKDLLKELFIALELLENDYLGGMGSRGYGRIGFEDMEVYWNHKRNYESGDVVLNSERKINGDASTPALLVRNFEEIKKGLA